MIRIDSPPENQLLVALPHSILLTWLPHLELVDLPLGKVLHESSSPWNFVYFPINGIVALTYQLKNGTASEVAVVGCEGMVGTSVILGAGGTPSCVVVKCVGKAYRLSACLMKQWFENSEPVRNLMLRFTQALMTQIGQTAVCNCQHSIEKRLCRWLLLCWDRVPGNDLVMTQELVANMLGVRRESVTEAALKLQSLHLIRYTRGHVTVLDRPGLERHVCECYAAVKKEYDRLRINPCAACAQVEVSAA